jgi:hypothetical protein
MMSLVRIVTAFLSLFPGKGVCVGVGDTSRRAIVDGHAMNQYGKWAIVRSNDPKVKLLPSPVVVEIHPGSFRIPGAVHGSFRFETDLSDQKKGIFVSMTPFSISLLRETYQMVPLEADRMGLFGQGRLSSRYYILERIRVQTF